jgi:hypothetical protein
VRYVPETRGVDSDSIVALWRREEDSSTQKYLRGARS